MVPKTQLHFLFHKIYPTIFLYLLIFMFGKIKQKLSHSLEAAVYDLVFFCVILKHNLITPA